MELIEVYKQIIKEIKNSIKYYNDEDIDFSFNRVNERFKFFINENIPSTTVLKDEDIKKKTEYENSLPKESRLLKIDLQVTKCKKCALYKSRNNTVFGEGNINADIMFIGEGPGENEDLTARPFVGKAGELLTAIIEKGMKLSRKDVYITNIVKCRPPGNRNPNNMEVSNCINYLHQQIKIINPKIIIPLGAVALSSLLPAYSGISRNKGKEFKLVLSKENIYLVIPTYHPAYVLRAKNDQELKNRKREVWKDIKKVMEKLNLSI